MAISIEAVTDNKSLTLPSGAQEGLLEGNGSKGHTPYYILLAEVVLLSRT